MRTLLRTLTQTAFPIAKILPNQVSIQGKKIAKQEGFAKILAKITIVLAKFWQKRFRGISHSKRVLRNTKSQKSASGMLFAHETARPATPAPHPNKKPPHGFAAAGGKVHSGYSGDRKTIL